MTNMPGLSYNERKANKDVVCKALSDAGKLRYEKDKIVTTRDIGTDQDLKLLVIIYEAQGKFEEAFSVIEECCVQAWTTNWSIAMMSLRSLEMTSRWEMLHERCTQILEKSLGPDDVPGSGFGKLGNDWTVWRYILIANREINSKLYSSRYCVRCRAYEIQERRGSDEPYLTVHRHPDAQFSTGPVNSL